MHKADVIKLLKQKPGYELVYLLLQSDQRRKELAEHAGYDGGTLQRWLQRAEKEGLVKKHKSIRNDEEYVEYSLACSIPSELIPIIEARGGAGPRAPRSDYADFGTIQEWIDPYSLETEESTTRTQEKS